MYNNDGSPAFAKDSESTSDAGAFAIQTDTDFTLDQNFLIGLGSVDGNGRMKPVATVRVSLTIY
jgi:hypothetical protein